MAKDHEDRIQSWVKMELVPSCHGSSGFSQLVKQKLVKGWVPVEECPSCLAVS